MRNKSGPLIIQRHIFCIGYLMNMKKYLSPFCLFVCFGIQLRPVILTYSQTLIEPRCEKTGLRGFRPGPTQTRLYSHRRLLEA